MRWLSCKVWPQTNSTLTKKVRIQLNWKSIWDRCLLSNSDSKSNNLVQLKTSRSKSAIYLSSMHTSITSLNSKLIKMSKSTSLQSVYPVTLSKKKVLSKNMNHSSTHIVSNYNRQMMCNKPSCFLLILLTHN